MDADAQAAIAADTQATLAGEAQAKQAPAPEARSDGTTLFHINIGFDTQIASYMRFSPSDVTVHVGDTVQWTQTSAMTPHTVTLVSGGQEPDLLKITPQTGGPPTVELNPVVLAPSGGSVYNGTGYFNSGFIEPAAASPSGPTTYSLTFTKPGKYEYICVLHDSMGMSGYVTVLPAGALPGMPATGQSTNLGGLMLALVGIALLVALSGLAIRRKGTVAKQ